MVRLSGLIAFAVLAVASIMLPGMSEAQKENVQPKQEAPEVIDDSRIGAPVAKGQLLVTLHRGVKEEELGPIFERLEAKFDILERTPTLNHYIIATDHERLPELRHRLKNHPYVAAAAYNELVSLARVTKDPVFKKPDGMPEDKDNWNLYRIKAPEAWDITQGGALVAVIDSGAMLDHEELVGRTTNPFSFATNGPDMQMGMKKIKRDKDRFDMREVRDHGTHVAITIAGKADNELGTAGVAPNSPLMPLQALHYLTYPKEDAGDIRGWNSSVPRAIARALDAGAPVINMSIGGLHPDKLSRWRAAKSPQEKQQASDDLLADANESLKNLGPILDRANEAGAILVVAAGNEGVPAEFGAYALSKRCIIVAATTREDERCDFSNYGPFTTVSAPGKDIWSGGSEPGKLYRFDQGTSMACPHVAGVVALMKTIDPELKVADVADILVKTGRPLKTDQPIGPLVDAKAALDEVRRRQATRVPRQPDPAPITPTPVQPPTVPDLPPDAIEILRQPDPWNNPDVRRIIQVWFSFANPRVPVGGDANGVWIFNFFGQVINVRTATTIQQPIWFEFRFRFFWENALLLESTNMGTLYEFIVGTLRQGRFNAAPPRERVPEKFRPRDNDPRPRVGGVPFNPNLGGSRWAGRNARGDTLEFEFDKGFVTIKRQDKATRYSVRLNTTLRPGIIDFYPDGGGVPLLGLIELVGFGELLVRTDFNDKRPVSISRGDPATFILKRADVIITEPGASDDGVQMPILHRGIETIIRNLTPNEKFDPKKAFHATVNDHRLVSYALSGDGQRLWLLVLTLDPKGKKHDWKIWSMKTDGTDARSYVPLVPEKTEYGYRDLYTNHDGTIAWLHIAHKFPFTNDNQAFLQRVPLGGAPQLVVDTNNIKGVIAAPEMRLTADGKAMVVATNLGILRIDGNGAHHVMMPREHLEYKGSKMDGVYGALAISVDGTRWAARTEIGAFKGPGKSHPLVVKGSGMNVTAYEEKAGINQLSMSDDGQIVAIASGLPHKPRLHLWRGNAPTPFEPEAAWTHGAILSGSGRILYGVSAGNFPYLVNLQSGRKMSLHSGLWNANDVSAIKLSRDGSLLSAFIGTYDFSPNGVFLHHVGVAPTSLHPQIRSVRQRYDGGKLVVTVEAETKDSIGKTYLFPLKNGAIPPTLVFPPNAPQNALGAMHVGFDVNRLEPTAKRPGVYQAVIDMESRHAYLDNTYSIRVVVTNADRTRATFQDVAILK